MEKKTDLLGELLKQIKTKEQFYELKDQLFKRGIESLLQSELDNHLGYAKHEKSEVRRANSRNGTTEKTIKTELGDEYP